MDHTLTPSENSLPLGPILCLDTTGNTLMAALIIEGEIRQAVSEASTSHRYHSATLIPTLQTMLAAEKMAPTDLQGLAVNIGPGSFTGIRTGLTAIRTMAQCLNLPIYDFNTFELMACFFPGQTLAFYLDALRDRAYHAVLSVDDDGKSHNEVAPVLITVTQHTAPQAHRYLTLGTIANINPSQPNDVLEAMALFTPNAMAKLLSNMFTSSTNDTTHSAQPWQTIQPLYLQQPSVTVKQPLPQPG